MNDTQGYKETKTTMIQVSEDDDRLIGEKRQGQADCGECARYPQFSGRKGRRWYWETSEKETLCDVCPDCGLIRRFEAKILLGAELLARIR